MVEMKSLTIWVEACPKIHQFIKLEKCKKCDYHVSIINNKLQCIYEEK